MAGTITSNAHIDMDDVFQKLGSITMKMEDSISTFIDGHSTMSTSDVQNLSFMMQKWSVCTQMESNTIKSLSESMKSVIQNIR
jgi:hypothetical protein